MTTGKQAPTGTVGASALERQADPEQTPRQMQADMGQPTRQMQAHSYANVNLRADLPPGLIAAPGAVSFAPLQMEAQGSTLQEPVKLSKDQEGEEGQGPGHAPAQPKGNPEAAKKTERLEFRATKEFLEALDFLARDEQLSRPDIIRRSVGLYARIRMEIKRGRQLAVVEPAENRSFIKDYIHL